MAAEELAFRQHYAWSYRRALEDEGARNLVCKRVCKARREAGFQAFRLVQERFEALGNLDLAEGADELVARQVLKELLKGEDKGAPSEAELDMLMGCSPTLPDEDVCELEVLSVLAALWHLVQQRKAEWRKRVQHTMRKAALAKALRSLNGGEVVRSCEVNWLQERMLSIRCEQGLEDTKMLLCVAAWFLAPQESGQGLSRALLLQRLHLEQQLAIGLRNFLLWGTVFTCFALALIRSESLEHCQSIKGILDTKLRLEEAEGVTAPRDIHDFASQLSELVSDFAPLSSAYFLGDQAWTLLDEPKTFKGPVRLPHLMEPEPNEEGLRPKSFFIGGAFTLQAWVRTVKSAGFKTEQGLSLLSKSLMVGEKRLTCWSWRFPLQLRFGGHDYGPASANSAIGAFEDRVRVDYDVQEEISGYALHTLRVNTSTATFMVGTSVIGSVALPRPVTDCAGEELSLGDKALTLASVRFYPRELSTAEVAQIFSTGLTWNEVARTSRPQRMKEVEVEDEVQGLSLDTLTSQIWQASTLLKSSGTHAAPVAYNNPGHEVLGKWSDGVLGLPYWGIQEASAYFGASSRVVVPGTSIPQREEQRGFTLSSWVKTKELKGGYLLVLMMPLFSEADVQSGNTANPIWEGFANICWGAFVGARTGFFARSREGDKLHDFRFLDMSVVDSTWHLRGAASRHLAFSLDTANRSHPVRVCIDGKCMSHAGETPASNCLQTGIAQAYPAAFREKMLNQTRLFLSHRFPHDYLLNTWQMQTKFFESVLSDVQVERLFQEEKDPSDQRQRPIRETQGCSLASEVADDPSYRDSFGQDCKWYLTASSTNEVICHKEAQRACPMACAHWEVCWGSPKAIEADAHLLWPRQLDFEPRGEYGTICVARSTTAEREAIACARSEHSRLLCEKVREGNATHCEPRDCSHFLEDPRFLSELGRMALRQELLQCLGDTQTRLRNMDDTGVLNILPCKDIILLQRSDCAWDDGALEALSGQIESTGAWSMSFWYQGMSDLECSEPQIRLLDTQSQMFLRLGAEEADIPNRFSQGSWHGESCNWGYGLLFLRTADANGGTEVARPVQRLRKHFLEIGSTDHGKRLWARVNEDENWEPMADPQTAKWPGLRVINVLGTVRISAMQLRASFPPRGQSLSRSYTEQDEQSVRVGPTASLEAQISQTSLREYKGYRQKTTLIAPPIVLLQRQGEGACSTPELVTAIHSFGQQTHCQHPYECTDYDRSSIYKCKSAEGATGKHFGERPLKVQGRNYYMEFLDTLTANAVIVREEDGEFANRSKARSTRDFVDLLTDSVEILALFHSVEFGIMTLMRVAFDTSQGRVRVSSELLHVVSAADSTLRDCILLCAVCLVCMAVLLANVAYETCRVSKAEWPRKFQKRALDVLLALVTCLLICFVMTQVISSEQEVRAALDKVLAFDWDGTAASGKSTHIKEEFLRMIFDIDEHLFHGKDATLKTSTLLSLLLLMRVVYTTSRHPRMELITRTMELAGEDLMHFIFLMGLVLLGFALLGTWMFGQTRKDFRNPLVTSATLIDTVLGPPGSLPILDESYSENALIYAVVFHMICFFLLLNFALAIVVDNYAKVQEEVRQCTTEQAFPKDVWSLIRFRWLRVRHHFPAREKIDAFLCSLKLDTVTVEDLRDGGLFKGQQAADAFFKHYSRYDFLSAQRSAKAEQGGSSLLFGNNESNSELFADILEMKKAHKESSSALLADIMEMKQAHMESNSALLSDVLVVKQALEELLERHQSSVADNHCEHPNIGQISPRQPSRPRAIRTASRAGSPVLTSAAL